MNLLVTGSAGFIGANLVRYWLDNHPNDSVVSLDKLVYGRANLAEFIDHPRHTFVQGDIADAELIERLFVEHRIESVIHAAAQSHVDVSIQDPVGTIHANVIGTAALLEGMRRHAKVRGRFHLVSTDEVFGSLGDQDAFRETSPYSPNNPYSASKAASDHLVRAYHRTFGIDVSITNCSNNYGPHQYPDKFLPKMICNGVDGQPLPVYGDGKNIREWLFVDDHCRAIDLIFHNAKPGSAYCVGGRAEWQNIELVHLLCEILDEKLDRPAGTTARQIAFVADRPGHDYRYAMDSSRLRSDLGWSPQVSFEDGLETTVNWYLSRPDWIEEVRASR
ncbi:MAG: dTDP-glucose 4,6-dehydratase [Candidatus Poribacteria bacterium]|nr:dTDP-glucose 4,6-dehydratase [Candidatus Poribacteria bacterium]